MPELYLIRHSKTEGNEKGRYIGSTDEPLSQKGRDILMNRSYPAADILYVSPMVRCKETAKVIYPDVPCRIVEEFREISFGFFENKNYLELQSNPNYQKWVDSEGSLPLPGGEDTAEFKERCCLAFEETVQDIFEKQYRSCACIIHGGTIMSIMERYALPIKGFYDWQIKNAESFHVCLERELWEDRRKIILIEHTVEYAR